MMLEAEIDPDLAITVSTPLGPDKMRVVAKQVCRHAARVEPIAHDRFSVPQIWTYELNFRTPEDRDKVVIALRMAEREGAVAHQHISMPLQKVSAG